MLFLVESLLGAATGIVWISCYCGTLHFSHLQSGPGQRQVSLKPRSVVQSYSSPVVGMDCLCNGYVAQLTRCAKMAAQTKIKTKLSGECSKLDSVNKGPTCVWPASPLLYLLLSMNVFFCCCWCFQWRVACESSWGSTVKELHVLCHLCCTQLILGSVGLTNPPAEAVWLTS